MAAVGVLNGLVSHRPRERLGRVGGDEFGRNLEQTIEHSASQSNRVMLDLDRQRCADALEAAVGVDADLERKAAEVVTLGDHHPGDADRGTRGREG